MKAIVSVIVPCYNQGKFLSETLESVINQTYKNWECVIINDGSTDNTEEVAQEWIKKDKRFNYIFISNSGVSNARNIGIQNCNGFYILPLDGDDKLSENYIQEMVSNLDNNTTLVYGNVKSFGVNVDSWIPNEYDFNDLIFGNMIHCSGMFRIADFKRINGYDVNMKEGYEDWEFWINLLKYNRKAKKVDSAYLFYRSHLVSRMREITLQKRYNLIAYIFHKHYNLYEVYYNNYSKNININFAYCFYLSAKMYNTNKVKELRNYYNYRLKLELKKYTFVRRKMILISWFKKGKLNLTIFDVLLK
jgi:glycosyltransferase involved in cell wall biosynthesis